MRQFRIASVRFRAAATGFVVLAAGLAFACTDLGESPTNPGPGNRTGLTFLPSYSYLGGSHSVGAPINRIRLTARNAASNAVLKVDTVTVDPNQENWNLTMDIPLTGELNVIVLIELINLENNVEAVQWSGNTAPISVAPGVKKEPAPVTLFQGPPANLQVTAVTVSPRTASLVEGDSVQLAAVVAGPSGTVVVWSSLDANATVSATGRVRGVSPGNARIVAVAGPRADTATVSVLTRVAAVRVSPDSARLSAFGAEATFSARVLDPRGAEIAGSVVNWTLSDASVAENLGNGRFRARANGSATVTATSQRDGRIAGTARLIVAQRASVITIDPTSATLTSVGARATFTASVRDAVGNPVAGAVSWRTGNAAVATIDGAGVATATGAGSTTIRAVFGAGTPDSLSAGASLVVTQQPRTIELTPADLSLEAIGDSARLSAVVKDANGNTISGLTALWTATGGAVTVDAAGLLRAVAAGSAIVQVAVGDLRAFTNVRVVQKVARVTIAPVSLNFASLGQVSRLAASAFDRNNNVVPGKRPRWSSANAAIVTVDSLGDVRSVSNGVTMVGAQIDDVLAQIPVTVAQVTHAVLLAPDTIRLRAIGDTARFTASARDANGNLIAGAVFTWVSLDTAIVGVDAVGKVMARKDGTARISAARQSKADTAIVVVTTLPNLRVSGLTVLPADSVTDGDTVAVTMTLQNTGAAAAGPFSARIMALDAATGAIVGVTASDSVTFPGAAAGSSTTMTFKRAFLPPSPWPDSVRITFVVDPANAVAETDETDNAVTSSVRRIKWRVQQVLAGPDTMRFKALNATAPITTSVRDRFGRPLTRPISFMSQDTGIAKVDAAGVLTSRAQGSTAVIVTSEAKADTVRVIISIPPNLKISPVLTVTPADSILDGDSAAISFSISNTSSVAAPASMARVALMHAGTNAMVDDTILSIPAIAAGATIPIAFKVFTDVPVGFPDSVRVRGELDYLNAIVESDETDNVISSGVRKVRFRVASVVASLDSVRFSVIGDSIPVGAVPRDRYGRTLIGRPLLWISQDTAIATVNAVGVIRAKANGTTRAIVASDGKADTVRITVATLAPGITKLWVGGAAAAPGDWAVAANWSPAGRPGATDVVLIPNGRASYPILSAHESIAGVVIEPASSIGLGAFNLTVSARFENAGAISGTGTLVLNGNGIIGGPLAKTTVLGGNWTVQNRVTVSSDLSLSGGSLVLNGRTVVVSGNFAASGGQLRMMLAGDSLRVLGGFSIEHNNTDGALTNGVLEIKGDFRGHYNSFEAFRASGSHRTVLSGTTAQRINIDHPGQRWFHHLVVNNPAGVTLDQDLLVRGDLELRAGTLNGAARSISINGHVRDFTAGNALRVTNTNLYNTGSLELPSSATTTYFFHGLGAQLASSFSVTGGVNLPAGSLRLNGRKVTLSGTFSVYGGLLIMQNPADTIDVGGDFTIEHNNTTGWLTAGVIKLAGNFRGNYNSYEAYRPSGTHTLLMAGSAAQSINIDHPGQRWLNHLVINNAAGVSIAQDLLVKGAVTIQNGTLSGAGRTASLEGNLIDAVGNRYTISNTNLYNVAPTLATIQTNLFIQGNIVLPANLAVTGSINLPTGSLTLNGRKVTVSQNFAVYGGLLVMTNAADTLRVGNEFSIEHNNTDGKLTNGVIEIGGNFRGNYNSFEAFRPSGNHKVIMRGSSAQAINIDHPGQRWFQHLILDNPAGVSISQDLLIKGDITILNGNVTGSGRTVSLYGNLHDAADNRWLVSNTNLYNRTPTVPATFNGNVFFQDSIALQTNLRVTGSANLPGSGKLNLNGRKLTVGSFAAYGGLLIMKNAADTLDVGSDFSIEHNNTDGFLTAGLIRLKGNFRGNYNSFEAFRPSGTHTVLLDGSSAQTINIDHPGQRWFNHLVINNAAGVSISQDLRVNGNITIMAGTVTGASRNVDLYGNLTDAAGGRWQVTNTTIRGATPVLPASVATNLYFPVATTLQNDIATTLSAYLPSGTLTLNGRRLSVAGSFSASGGLLKMTNPLDTLDVTGAFSIEHNNTAGQLTAGAIKLKGNFRGFYNSFEAFRPSGSHTVIFQGSTPQDINIDHPGQRWFHNLTVRPGAAVTFSQDLLVNGTYTNLGTTTIAAGRTVDVAGHLALTGGTCSNSGTFKYGTKDAGTCTPNAPVAR